MQDSKDFVRRIQDDEDEDLDEDLHQPSSSLSQSSDNNSEVLKLHVCCVFAP